MRRTRIRIAYAAVVAVFLVSICKAQQVTPAGSKDAASPALPPGPIISGDGTPGYIPIWQTTNYLTSSVLYQANGNVGIGTTSPAARLDVNGSLHANGNIDANGTINATTYEIGNQAILRAGGSNTTVGVYTGGGGDDNTFVGADSGEDVTSGEANSFLGIWSGINISSGSLNTFLGAGAGGNVTTGNTNIMIGPYAGGNNMTGNNDIYVGNFGGTTSNESSTMRLGLPYSSQGSGCGNVPPPCGQKYTYIAGIFGTSVAGVPVFVNASGQIGTLSSSLRFKEQVQDMGDSTDALMRLRPVTFFYKPEYTDGEREVQYGLIAEEVAKVYPELVAYGNDGQPFSVRYQYLSTMLLNEAQKQSRRGAEQAEVIATQQQRIAAQQQEIETLRQQLQAQNTALQERLSRLESMAGAKVTIAKK